MSEVRSGSGYIPAIDGLRALAVSAVVVYHLWPNTLPGGFTGVDIFFVISGFVVTRSVLGKSFDTMRGFLAWFYARRLMRIMPALLAMLLVTILATQLFVPDSWLSNSIPAVGTSAFFGLSNILLATDTESYFGPQAGYNPFTHTWSLGVEEQFYLIFPLLLFPLLRSARDPLRHRLLVRRVALLSIASLLVAAWLPQRYAFYLILSRFWELGAGMLLCLTMDRWQTWAARMHVPLTLAGIALIGTGLAWRESAYFPFPLALLPVLGTAALIAVVITRPENPLTRALALRPAVGLGHLSYSLYLWHWPVFVLFRWTVGLHTLPLQFTALALALALSVASYRLIENPLRNSPRIAAMPRGRVAGRMAMAVVALGLLGAGLFAAHDRITLSVTRDHAAWYPDNRRALPASAPCKVVETTEKLAGGTIISFTPQDCTRQPFALHAMGDSHNRAYTPAYRRLASEGVPVRTWFRAGCPMLKLIDPDPSRCAEWFAAQEADLAAHAKRGDVLFFPALRMTRYTNQFEDDPALIDYRGDDVQPADLFTAQAMLRRQHDRGLSILLEGPKPIFRSPPVRCADWFNRANPICAGGLSIARDEIERRRWPVMGAMTLLAATVPETRIWDPLPLLCSSTRCDAMENGRPRFLDGDHLSGHGNDELYPHLRAAIFTAARK